MKKILIILSLILFIPNIAYADTHKIIDADIQEYIEALGRRDMKKVNSYKVLEVIDDGKHKNSKEINKEEKNKKELNNPKTGIDSIIPITGVLILNLISYKKIREA